MPARRIDDAERRARLAVRHRLVPTRPTDDVVAIADDLVALHSSDPVSVHLSVLARMAHPALAAVEKALYDDRTLVRHHAMRRTLWVAGHAVTRLAHAAATVDVHRVERRKLCVGLSTAGIADPDAWMATGRTRVLDLLAEGPLPAREIGRRLPELTMPVHAGRLDNLLPAHTRLLLVLGFAGAVLRARPTGTWINGQYRWADAAAWLPGGVDTGLDKRTAAAGLARRWLRAFGPGTRTDLAWWAGWTAATATRALADVDAVAVELDGGTTGFVLPDDLDPPPPAEPWVALLPGLDPTTMGWKDRTWYLDPAVGAAVFDRNGNGGPAVWVDGRIVGSWVQRADGTVAVRLLTAVDPACRVEIDAAADRLRALLGDVRFRVRFPAPVQGDLLERDPP